MDREDGSGTHSHGEGAPGCKESAGGFREVTLDNEAAESDSRQGGFGCRFGSGTVDDGVTAGLFPQVVAPEVGGGEGPFDRDSCGRGGFPGPWLLVVHFGPGIQRGDK